MGPGRKRLPQREEQWSFRSRWPRPYGSLPVAVVGEGPVPGPVRPREVTVVSQVFVVSWCLRSRSSYASSEEPWHCDGTEGWTVGLEMGTVFPALLIGAERIGGIGSPYVRNHSMERLN